jgi:hypothetical protein
VTNDQLTLVLIKDRAIRIILWWRNGSQTKKLRPCCRAPIDDTDTVLGEVKTEILRPVGSVPGAGKLGQNRPILPCDVVLGLRDRSVQIVDGDVRWTAISASRIDPTRNQKHDRNDDNESLC